MSSKEVCRCGRLGPRSSSSPGVLGDARGSAHTVRPCHDGDRYQGPGSNSGPDLGPSPVSQGQGRPDVALPAFQYVNGSVQS